jgi:hypothetical protein
MPEAKGAEPYPNGLVLDTEELMEPRCVSGCDVLRC